MVPMPAPSIKQEEPSIDELLLTSKFCYPLPKYNPPFFPFTDHYLEDQVCALSNPVMVKSEYELNYDASPDYTMFSECSMSPEYDMCQLPSSTSSTTFHSPSSSYSDAHSPISTSAFDFTLHPYLIDAYCTQFFDTLESNYPFEYLMEPLPMTDVTSTMSSLGITADLDFFSSPDQSVKSEPLHKVVHDNRPYPCRLCNRAFARKHDLQRHIRVHTGEKPYNCPCCKKAFARTDALKRHLTMEIKCQLSEEVQSFKKLGKKTYNNLRKK